MFDHDLYFWGTRGERSKADQDRATSLIFWVEPKTAAAPNSEFAAFGRYTQVKRSGFAISLLKWRIGEMQE